MSKNQQDRAQWKYYVYELTDPRSGAVFYVGKGCGDRIDEHEKETARGVCSKKCNKIRRIVNAGLKIGKCKIAYFKDEADAFAYEDERIRFYGKDRLTNVAPLLGNEDSATENAFLSEAAMRLMAIGFLAQGGIKPRMVGKGFVFADAVYHAFMRKFGEMTDKVVASIGFDALRDGVRKYGVELVHGGKIA